MPSYSPIFTNHVLNKMRKWVISESTLLDALNNGDTESAKIGGRWNAIKKYPGYEIGVNYDQKQTGQIVIISVWKRERR